MIRPTAAADAPRLIELTTATGVFRPDEIDTLRDIFDDYIAGQSGPNHCCFTSELAGQLVGYVYLGAEEMTDRTWYIWWIAVDPSCQGKGTGRELLRFAEDEVRRRGGRVLFIETSGLPGYEATRRFYLKNGYDREAVLRDFYHDGDDMVVFRKRLAE